MNEQGTQIVTRIAPSPTGRFHIGTARTALFNFLYARKCGGRFLVRYEDTDRARSTKESELDIATGLAALGLSADHVVRQSERVALHRAHLERLVEMGRAYVSSEPARDDASRSVNVVRLKNPGSVITFHDEVRGDITFDTTELGDLIIARAIDDPLYHFAVVVDDADMGVTHVIRGEDHISNTPRQILIQEALGLPRPVYAHLPLILAPDRSKMSKRKGATAITDFITDGFYPEAIVNYLALLGWNPGTAQEIFSMDELVEAFSLDGIQKGGAVFDIDRFKWINREHGKRLGSERVVHQFATALAVYPGIAELFTRSPAARTDMLERYATSGDLTKAIDDGEFAYYIDRPTDAVERLAWKKDPAPERVPERLSRVAEILQALDTFSYDTIRSAIHPYAESEGTGAVLWPLRVALSGRDRSPDPYVLAEALGRGETLARIELARNAYVSRNQSV